MTGERLSTETLKASLVDATLQAQIDEQNFKAAQARSQLSQLKFSAASVPPAPPPEKPVLAAAPQPTKALHKKMPPAAPVAAVAAMAPPAPVPVQSPVAGVMEQGGVLYALLQFGDKGEMAKSGEIIDGHHLDAVTQSGVVLDGRSYPVAAPITKIDSVDSQAPGGGRENSAPALTYGGIRTASLGTPSPFSAHNAGNFPPLPMMNPGVAQ
jgi:hypothetical protein